MGGMYNMILGDGGEVTRSGLLLSVIGASEDVLRIRDAWVENGSDGEPVIAIYTRQGGGNRECYCADYEREHPHPSCNAASNERLTANQFYLRDADDEFDSRAPPEYREALSEIMQDPVDMSNRWRQAIIAMGGNPDD